MSDVYAGFEPEESMGVGAAPKAPQVPQYGRYGTYRLVTHDRRRRLVNVDNHAYRTALDAKVAAPEDDSTGLQQWKRRDPPTELEDVADLYADWKDRPERGGLVSEATEHEIEWVRYSPDDNVRQYVIWSGVYRTSGTGVGGTLDVRPFGLGDLVISISDRRWGTVESVKGDWRGIRFGNDEAAVRHLQQLERGAAAMPVAVGELLGKQAALDAQKLTKSALEFKQVISAPEMAESIAAADSTLAADFEKFLNNWHEFVSRLAGTDIPSWSKLGQLAQGFWLMFDRKDIYAAVQAYRTRFKTLVTRYRKAIGGEPLEAEVGSTAATQAATDAEKLTADMLDLKHALEVQATYDEIQSKDPSYIPGYNQLLASWERFLKQAAGQNVAWWNLPKKAVHSLWVIFDGTSLFNTTQDYRQKYNEFYAKAEQLLGKPPTASKPESPKQRKEDKTPTERMDAIFDKLVTGVLVIGGVVGGGFLVLKLAGK